MLKLPGMAGDRMGLWHRLQDLRAADLGMALAVAIIYAVAAHLGLGLKTPEGVTQVWPAAGVAIGAMLILKPAVRPLLVAGIMAASLAAKLLGGYSLGVALVYTLANAGEALLVVALIERWLPRPLALDDLRSVLGLFAATGFATILWQALVALALQLAGSTPASFLDIWHRLVWSNVAGIVLVAPALITLATALRTPPPRHKLIEGTAVLGLHGLVSAHAFALLGIDLGHWMVLAPLSSQLPVLLWLSIRCGPLFAATGSMVLNFAMLGSFALGRGRFGDTGFTLTERVFATHFGMLAISLVALAIAALITERERAEAAARRGAIRSLQDLDRAQAVAHTGSWRLDINRNELSWSAENHRIFGLIEGTPMTYETFLNIVHPDDRAVVDREWKAAVRGAPYDIEHRIVVDGAVKWVRERAALEYDAAGRLLGGFGTTQDISDKKKAEQALRESQAQLALDLNAMTRLQKIGTLFVREGDFDPVLGEIVDTVIAISGADMGNIQLLDPATGDLRIVVQRGFPPWWLDYWDAVQRGQVACGTALERGKRVIIEDIEKSPIFAGTAALDIQLRAGVRAVQSTPLVSRSGQMLGMFSTHYRTPQRPDERALRLLDLLARQTADIVERKTAETALLDSQQRLRAVIDTAVDAVIVIDETGRIQSANPATARIFGYTPAEMIGRNTSMLMPDPHRSAHEGYIRSFLDTGKAKIIGIGREVEGRRKDGTTFPVDLAVVEWRLEGRRYFTGIMRDITERKRREEQVRLLLKEVNHRAKNMLSVVQAIAWQTTASGREAFIERFSERIQALAANQDLLVKSQWRGVELADLMRSQLAHFGGLIGSRIALEGPPLRVTAKAAQAIGMALHELATNAGKYGALCNGLGEVRIAWAIDRDGGGKDRFCLSWSERGGPEVRAPSRRGFGTMVIDQMPRMQLAADIELDYAPSGVSWRLACAAEKVLENAGADAGARERAA
jgi:PAS domain S-box-containing protein